jgi:hypothetical protein
MGWGWQFQHKRHGYLRTRCQDCACWLPAFILKHSMCHGVRRTVRALDFLNQINSLWNPVTRPAALALSGSLRCGGFPRAR